MNVKRAPIQNSEGRLDSLITFRISSLGYVLGSTHFVLCHGKAVRGAFCWPRQKLERNCRAENYQDTNYRVAVQTDSYRVGQFDGFVRSSYIYALTSIVLRETGAHVMQVSASIAE